MRILHLTIIIFILLFIACSKDETANSDCIETMLSNNSMIEYTGQELECKFFLELYSYTNKQFFLLGNHCADLISYPIDCAGNTLCEDGENFICNNFYAKAERIGIIGIEQ